MPDKIQISLRDVSFTYAAVSTRPLEVLHNISLDIHEGEHVCVLGGNGSGKSTLVQLMNALLAPSRGTVEVFGIPSADPAGARAIRRRAAMVFQHPDDQMVTSVVADDVAFGPENLGVAQPEIVCRVDAALAAVDLSAMAHADPADLSGGQRQRVAIAGALAMEPEILLLDEPSAMLDTEGHRAIRRIIAKLSARNITIVHVTHFMDDALRADRAILLDHGRIALDGVPEEVFSHGDEIRALGLDLPFAMRLVGGLAERGIEVPSIIDSKALADWIATRLERAEPRARQTDWGPSRRKPSHFGPRAGATAPEQTPAIEFEHVSFSYENARSPRKRRLRRSHRTSDPLRVPLALDDVSFSVMTGALTALIGATGSGKSTSVELACALKLPLAGQVRVEGIDTANLTERRLLRRRIGYISQLPERQLFAETVYADIAFGPRNLHLSEAEVDRRVRAALDAVGLEADEDLLARSPFELSGGQQRSVAIAGVLAMRTPILVLDEPMAGLDPCGRARMRELAIDLRSRGTTLLMITHSMDDVANLADEVVVLGRGRRCAQGTPAQVFIEQGVGLGEPGALAFSRLLRARGAHRVADVLTLHDLVEEVSRELTV